MKISKMTDHLKKIIFFQNGEFVKKSIIIWVIWRSFCLWLLHVRDLETYSSITTTKNLVCAQMDFVLLGRSL